MFISKIAFRMEDKTLTEISRAAAGDLYHDHQLVWHLFEGAASGTRPFIYRRNEKTGFPEYIVVSHETPRNNDNIWDVVTKPYQPKIKMGARLGFSLIANPVRSRHDENGKQHRHDVVMEMKRKLITDGKPRLPIQEIVYEAGKEWLEARSSQNGFSIIPEFLRVDGYRQRSLQKSGSKPITFSTVEFSGALEVVHPEHFIRTLYRGIGAAKGFGCGLMLVRRI